MGIKKKEIQHFTDMPGIQHFAEVKVSKNDNVYGVKWANLVRKFFETVYEKEMVQAEVVSDGITYKVLKREKVTVFYDAEGNTLFDVENKRLEKEYRFLMKETAVSEPAAPAEATPDEDGGKEVPIDAAVEKVTEVTTDDIKAKAISKLDSELEKLKDVFEKKLAMFCMGYLKDRCTEDQAMCEDVLQEHKTLKKCLEYTQGQAKKEMEQIAQKYGKKLSGEVCLPVDNEKVFEWAEDYFHLDDKAIEEQKVKEEAERKKKQEEAAKKIKTKQKSSKKKNKPAAKKAEQETVKKNTQKKKEIEGQMDLFSMMRL